MQRVTDDGCRAFLPVFGFRPLAQTVRPVAFVAFGGPVRFVLVLKPKRLRSVFVNVSRFVSFPASLLPVSGEAFRPVCCPFAWRIVFIADIVIVCNQGEGEAVPVDFPRQNAQRVAETEQLIELVLKDTEWAASERGLGFVPDSNCRFSNRSVSLPCNLCQPDFDIQASIH
ncbi:MAG: hypothetical protein ABGZ53_03790 [Fuerstiella sp.]